MSFIMGLIRPDWTELSVELEKLRYLTMLIL